MPRCLLTPPRVQRGVQPALHPLLRVPYGFAVANDVKLFHGSCFMGAVSWDLLVDAARMISGPTAGVCAVQAAAESY